MPILAVAPHWGAWIEIGSLVNATCLARVAPHWGAWIEIPPPPRWRGGVNGSHPTGVRGLKFRSFDMSRN